MNRSALLKIYPPYWILVFLVVAYFFHATFPATRVFDFSYPALGVLLCLAGIALSIWSARAFRKSGTEFEPDSPGNSSLVTEPPYSFSRNPMYLGGIVLLLGIALIMGTLPFYLAILAQFFVVNFLFIPFEEEKMSRQFGERYNAFKSHVRRWV